MTTRETGRRVGATAAGTPTLSGANVIDNPQTLCRACVTPIGFIDCPTGGWWAHETHPADDHNAVPGAWVDGDELMETIAAEVWEHCAIEGTASVVVDDPRNIAGTAAAVARRMQPAEMEQLRRERDLAIAHDRQPYPTAWAYEQACKALRRKSEAIERVLEFAAGLDETGRQLAGPDAVHPVAAHIRHLLDTRAAEAQQQPDTETRCTCGGRFPLQHLHADTHAPAVSGPRAADNKQDGAQT